MELAAMRTLTAFGVWVALLMGAPLACGGTVQERVEQDKPLPEDNELSGGEQPGSGRPSGAPDADRTVDPQETPDLSKCPSQKPPLDTPCGEGRAICMYGSSVRVDCREVRVCRDGKWQVDEDRETCQTPPADYCSSAIPEGACDPIAWSGERISGEGQAFCDYPDGTLCYCRLCTAEGCAGNFWDCSRAPEDPQCPSVAPNQGSRCDAQGVSCDYGEPCRGGGSYICMNATWYPLPRSCR
jgi:hypothetical protein